MPGQKLKFLWLIVVLLLSSACLVGQTTGQEDSQVAEAIQEDIDQLNVLYSSQSIPEHFFEENAIRNGDEFDPNMALEILNHLRMEEGFTLDYVYDANPMGGYPELYARGVIHERYATLSDYSDAHPQCFNNDAPAECFYLNHIKTDDTEDGFLQLVILYRMGDQFYLDWHANYNDAVVIVANEGLEKVISERSNTNFGVPFTRSQQAKAKRIDPTPLVTFTEDTVEVQVLWFTKWGGFYKTTYQVNRQLPHLIDVIDTHHLLKYECDIMF